MKTYASMNESKTINPAKKILFIIVFCILCELFIFNHSYFFEVRGNQQEVSLPFNESAGQRGVILNPQNNSLTINEVNKPINRIRVETHGPEGFVRGKISLTDDSSSVIMHDVNTFAVNPGGDKNYFTVSLLPNGNTHTLKIEFTDLRFPILVSSIKIDAPSEFSFSTVRTLFFILLFVGTYVIVSNRLYEAKIDFEKKEYRVINYLCLSACLAVSLFYFYFTNPMTSTSMVWNMPSYDVIQLGNPDKTLLLDYPKNQEELKYHDIYVKQMDAFNKGQTNLDVYVDPRQLTAERPYDQGYMMANNINFYYEATFYNGKYYSYYGLAPVFTIYYPIYLLTGKVPSPGLVCGLLSLMAVCAMFFAMRQIYRFFNLKNINALVFYSGEITVVAGSLVYVDQSMLKHYQIASLSMLFYLSLLVATSFMFLSNQQLNNKIKYILLVIAGISYVGIVTSRPLALFPITCILAPLFIKYIYNRYKTHHLNIIEILSVLIPIFFGSDRLNAF